MNHNRARRRFFLPMRFILLLSILLLFSSTAVPAFSQSQPDGIIIPSSANWGNVRTFPIQDLLSTLNLNNWRQAQFSGRGVRVGIMDLGFGGITDFERQFGVQVTIPELDKQTYNSQPIVHGTQVLEVVNGIAPGAELFACSYDRFEGYTNCIDWMIRQGVRIINHSAGVPALPLDGTNEWAREVDRVAREGILWVNAAGNFNLGYVRGSFTYFPGGGSYHAFFGGGSLGDTLEVPVIGNGMGRVMLSWEGLPTMGLDGNMIDLDLEIILANGQSISSNRRQVGGVGDRPVEWVTVDLSQPFWVRIRDVSGVAGGVRFVLFVEFANLPAGEQLGSIIAPGDSVNSLTVGALQNNALAPYSSRGLLSSAALKPDLVAPGEIRLASGGEFVGTSAAAPVVAGVAAMIWEANPDWTREQLYDYLKFSATLDDTEVPGPDNFYGQGRLNLPVRPPERVVARGPVNPGDNVIALPFRTGFDEAGTLDLWDYDPTVWQVNRLGGDNVLIGQGRLTEPAIVLSAAEPAWRVRSDEDLLVSFDFNLQQSSGGLRFIFRQNPDAGYQVLELFPGNLFLKRNNPNNIDFTNRDTERMLIQRTNAPINAESWHNISLWLSGSKIYIYLDRRLFVTAEDQNLPSLVAGDMLFQGNSANRQVRIDNFVVQRVERASDHFENANLPPAWQTSDTVNTTIGKEADNNQYLRMGARVTVSPDMPDMENVRLSCRIWSEQGGYQIRLRDNRDGALIFNFGGGNLEIRKVDDFGDAEWTELLQNMYNRGRWDDFTIEFIGNRLRIFRDGQLRYAGNVGGRTQLDAGVIRFVTGRDDILRLDACLISEVYN